MTPFPYFLSALCNEVVTFAISPFGCARNRTLSAQVLRGTWLLVLCASIGLGQSAQIENKGKSIDSDGKLVANASVHFHNTADTSKSQRVTGNSVGDFVAPASLADGVYKVCVQVPGNELYVDPCQWRKSPQFVQVKNGKLPANFTAQAERGVRVKVHINDQFRTLLPTGAANSPRLSTAILSETQILYGMRLLRRNATGLDYELIVPYDSDLMLHFSGAPAILSVSKGVRADTAKSGGQLTPLRITRGTAAPMITADIHAASK